jgi:homoserine kinase type II
VYENISTEMLKQIGTSMAKLHQISAPDFLPKLHPYGVQIFSTVIDKGIDKRYESWLSEQTQFLIDKLPKNLPKGLIHGDVFFDNVLFEDGKIKAIIDFEEACQYYLNFDLGMGILGLCRTNGKIDLTKVNALITGYEQIRLLEPLEKELLPLFIKYAAIATSWWRFWKYNIHSLCSLRPVVVCGYKCRFLADIIDLYFCRLEADTKNRVRPQVAASR